MKQLNEYRYECMYKRYYAAYQTGRKKDDDKRPTTQVQGLATWTEQGVNERPTLRVVR